MNDARIPLTSRDILKAFISRKREANPSYSLRALARDLTVSPSYLSSALSGKKRLSSKILGRLATTLELDEGASAALRFAANLEKIEDREVAREILMHAPKQIVPRFVPLSKKKRSMLERWYYVAILDLTTCDDFEPDEQWIAERLGLSRNQVRDALTALERLELIEKTVDRNRPNQVSFRKVTSKVRLPTVRSEREIRNFHQQMIERAQLELKLKTQQSDFDRRLMSGITMAIDPGKVKWARKRLEAAIHEISDEMMNGNCTEVYQLNVQLFPLTRRSGKRTR